MAWLAWFLLAGIVVGVLYWLLFIGEGTYLGPRVVTWLYDRTASRYDDIKRFEPYYEALFLGEPIARWLGSEPACLLDVATGTGRLPWTVLQAGDSAIELVALDRSLPMLYQASAKLQACQQVTLLQHDAEVLPFADGVFCVVTCLEALEFMARPRHVVVELWRVLQPGGLLALTGRIGWQAALMPGKALSRTQLTALLRDLGAREVKVQPWQADYELLWAVKASSNGQAVLRGFSDLVHCPRCNGAVAEETSDPARLACVECSWALTCEDGIWRPAQGSWTTREGPIW
jgi:ubiquinone/menaquinone biosynthesis C-methylase UbiE